MSVLKKRAVTLAAKLREVAKDILDNRLLPSTSAAVRSGRPVCAFGHALVRAASAESVTLPDNVISNKDGVKAFLNGEYNQELDTEVRDRLATLACDIEKANDAVFYPERSKCNCENCKSGLKESDVVAALEGLASALEGAGSQG